MLQWQRRARQRTREGDTVTGRSMQECLTFSCECWYCQEGIDQDS